MHTLEHMKVHRCTDQLIIQPELYSVSALYDAVVLILSLIKTVVHAPIFIPWMERDNCISLRDKCCIQVFFVRCQRLQQKTIEPERIMDENVKNMNTVVTRISGATLIKFFEPQMRRLFEGGAQ